LEVFFTTRKVFKKLFTPSEKIIRLRGCMTSPLFSLRVVTYFYDYYGKNYGRARHGGAGQGLAWLGKARHIS
jgi:hypothetical protein